MKKDLTEQEEIARISIMIAKSMKEYADLGYADYTIVGRNLTNAMEMVSNHLTEANQEKFADWLLKQAMLMKKGILNE